MINALIFRLPSKPSTKSTKIILPNSFDAANRVNAIPSYFFENGLQICIFCSGIIIHQCSHQTSCWHNINMNIWTNLKFQQIWQNEIINKTLDTPSITADSQTNETSNEITIYFRVTYYVNKGCSLIKSCIHKIKSNCKKEQSITFKVLYDVTKIDFFCSTKDKMPTLNQSFVVYEFVCPGCNADYVGKNGRTLFERNVEQAWSDN